MKKKVRILAALAALAMTMTICGCSAGGSSSQSASASSAASEQDIGLITSGVLTMATNAEFQPFEYYDGNDIVGIDVDLANAIAADLGLKLEVHDMTFDSVLAAVPAGKYDVGIAALSKEPDRVDSMDFSNPYYDATQVIIVKADNTEITGKDSLKGKKIAVQTATTGDTDAKDITGDANVQRFNAPTDAIANLKNGKSDAVIIDSLPASIFVSQNSDLKIINGGFDTEQYCITVKKGNTKLLAAINKAIADVKASGKLDEIIQKYTSASSK